MLPSSVANQSVVDHTLIAHLDVLLVVAIKTPTFVSQEDDRGEDDDDDDVDVATGLSYLRTAGVRAISHVGGEDDNDDDDCDPQATFWAI